MKEQNCNYTYPYEPGDYNLSCENLLPCGVCKLTGQMCPKHWTGPYVTWTCNNEVK